MHDNASELKLQKQYMTQLIEQLENNQGITIHKLDELEANLKKKSKDSLRQLELYQNWLRKCACRRQQVPYFYPYSAGSQNNLKMNRKFQNSGRVELEVARMNRLLNKYKVNEVTKCCSGKQ